MKTYSRRDSATSILRKMGISKDKYSQFITEDDNGYRLDLDAAKASLVKPTKIKLTESTDAKNARVNRKADLAKNKASFPDIKVENTRKAKVAKVVYEDYSAKVRQPYRKNTDNITNVCRDLIMQGKTNEEIWVIIKAKFDLDDKKRTYPSWYRSRMRSAGEI